MRPGTIIRLPDGREGTVVYHGLDGYGIMWGRVQVDLDAILATRPLFGDAPTNWPWVPQAMLRDECRTAGLPCVGEEYEIVEAKEDKG